MTAKVRLDHAGIGAILKSASVASSISALAESVASNAREQGIMVGDRPGGLSEIDLPVDVETYTTDRAAASVALAHPAGLAVQAKHGTLTSAAAAAGLEVRG